MTQLVAVFIVAMLLTVVLIPFLERAAPKFHLVDAPGGRKQHSHVTPRIGGLAMAVAFFVAAGTLLPMDRAVASLFGGVLVLVAFGVWDDRDEISYIYKFLGQIVAAGIVVFAGGLSLRALPLLPANELTIVGGQLLSMLFLVGATNAVNLSDGLDGLAGGLCLMILTAIAVLSLSGSAFVETAASPAVLALAAVGSLLGFLRFNSHPARVFMGDAGSQFLGFVASALALYVTQGAHTPVSSMLPLLLIGVPIYDTLSVMIRRIASGRSPFAADRQHIHYRLTGLGLSHAGAVLAIYLAQAVLILAACLGRFSSDAAILLVFALFCLALEVVIRIAQAGWLRPLTRLFNAAGRFRELTGGRAATLATLSRACAIVLSVFVVLATATAGRFSFDIGLFAVAVALGLMISIPVGRRSQAVAIWLDRGFAYGTVTIALYLLYEASSDPGSASPVLLLLVPLVPIVLLGFLLSDGSKLRLSPLDFLVLFSFLAIPFLPGLPAITGLQKWSLLGLLSCYYAIELMLSENGRLGPLARTLLIVALCIPLSQSLAG